MSIRLTIDIDPIKSFDAIRDAGQDAAGVHFTRMILSAACTRGISFIDRVTLEMYGVSVVEVSQQ